MKKRTVNVLMIEDDKDYFKMVVNTISDVKNVSFAIKNVGNLDKGLTEISKGGYDVVLLDLGLPDSDGLDTFRKVHDNSNGLPIVVLSGINDETVAMEAVKSGAQDYLFKTETKPELLSRMLIYSVDRKRLENEIKEAKNGLELRVREQTEELSSVNEELKVELLERLEIEETLLKSEAKYRQLLEGASVGIAIGQDGMLKFFNPILSEMLGYSDEEILSKSFSELMHPEDKDRALETHYNMIRGEEVPQFTQYRIIDGKGNLKWIEVNGIMTTWEEEPAVLNFISDITERKKAEDKLKDVNDIINRSPVVAFLWRNDEGWPVEFVSENVKDLFGYSAENFLTCEVIYSTVIHPEDIERVAGEVANYSSEKGTKLFSHKPYRIITKGGQIKWIDDRTRIITDESGKITHYEGIVLDITDRMRAKEELRESEEKWRDLFENSIEAVFTMDVKGNFTSINSALASIMGYEKEEIIGSNYAKYTTPEAAKGVFRAYNDLYRTGEPIRDFEYEFIRKDGEVRTVEAYVNNIRKEDKIIGFQGTLRDITERKQAEEALQESEKRFRVSATSVSDLIWDWNIQQDGLEWFGNIDEMLGCGPGEFPRTIEAWEKVIHPEDHDRVMAALEKHLRKGVSYSEEYRVICKDGSFRYWADRGSTILDKNGKTYRMIGACSDITERKRVEDALKASEAQLSNALRIAQAGHWEYDIASDTFTFNDNFYRIFRTTAEKVGGYRLSSADYSRRFCHPDDVGVVSKEVQAAIETTEPNYNSQVEHRILYDDGEVGYIAVRFFIVKDAQGRTVKTYGVNQDITESKRAEEALKDSEVKYRLLVENLNDVLFNIDLEGTVTYISPVLETFSGYKPEELLNTSFHKYIHPDDIEDLLERIKKNFEGMEEPYEYRVITKDGSTLHVRSSSRVLYKDGEPIGLSGIMTDITDRKQVEDALKKNEEKYRLLVENLNDVVFTLDLEGNITYVSPIAENLSGYKPEEFLNQPFLKYVHPDDLPGLKSSVERTLAGEREPYEYRFVVKDGTYRHVLSSSQIIFEDDQPVGLVGILKDITERQLMFEKLREVQLQQKALLDSIPDMAWLKDKDGHFVAVNQPFSRSCDVSPDELIGKTDLDIWPLELAEKYCSDDREVMESREMKRVEEPLEDVDGNRTWIETIKVPIFEEDGEVVGTVGIARDITERKEYEEKLIENTQYFRSLIDTLHEDIIVIDRDYIVTDINNSFLNKTGEKREKVLGRFCHDVICGSKELCSVNDRTCPHSSVLSTGKSVQVLHEQMNEDGSVQYTSILASPLKDSSGKIVNVIEAIRDVTDIHQAHEKVKESEEKYRILVENANDGIAIIKDGILKYVNRRTGEIVGYSVEEVLNKNFIEFIHPDEVERIAKIYDQRMADEDTVSIYESVLQHKNSNRVDVEFNTSTITYNGSSATQIIIRDITERKRAQEELVRLSNAVKMSNDGIVITDIEGKIVDINEKTMRMYGIDNRDEMIGKNAFELIGIEEKENYIGTIKKVLKDGYVSNIEYVAFTKKEHKMPVELSIALMKNPKGKNIGFVSIVRDIAERKHAEEALKESEGRFKNIAENSMEWIWEVDKKGKFIYSSPIVEKIFGYKQEEILDKHFYDLFHPEDKEALMRTAFEALNKKTPLKGYLTRCVKKNGETVWISTSGVPIIDDEGKPVGFRGAITDITESKLAEEAIKESEEKFRNLFETSRDVVFLTTLDGKFEDISQSGQKLFGYKRDELLSMGLKGLCKSPDSGVKLRKTIEENGFVEDYEINLTCKDGIQIDSLISATVRVDGEGSMIGYQGVIRDVTAKKKMEEKLIQTEKLSSLGGILSGVAHELNNPLTSIIGNAQLLARKNISSEIKDKLETIQKESLRCTKIIGGLLSFAREHKPERSMISINDVLNESYKLREYELRIDNVDFALELLENIPQTFADPFQLHQVFINLINNTHDALKNTGGGSLVIRSFYKDKNIIIEFEDDGPGIPADKINRIFDPFFTTKDVGEGTGLGLSIVYGIINEHNGEIRVETENGRGTKFIIELPVVEGVVDEEEMKGKEEIEKPEGVKSVLIVEDEDSLRDYIYEALLDGGYVAKVCGSVEEAIRLLEKDKYDVIVSDIKMPGLSGQNLYTYIQKHHPSLAEKLLFITGDVLGKETQSFFKITGVEFLEKPFDIEVLLKRIFGMVSHRV